MNTLVMGIGNGGCGLVRSFQETPGVGNTTFVFVDTDIQPLEVADGKTILLTANGLGVSGDPEKGRRAAEDHKDDILSVLKGMEQLILVAGLGGGTGTGATPVVAEIASELGITTKVFVIEPFGVENEKRHAAAQDAIARLREVVGIDNVLVISNQGFLEKLQITKEGGSGNKYDAALALADRLVLQALRRIVDPVTA